MGNVKSKYKKFSFDKVDMNSNMIFTADMAANSFVHQPSMKNGTSNPISDVKHIVTRRSSVRYSPSAKRLR